MSEQCLEDEVTSKPTEETKPTDITKPTEETKPTDITKPTGETKPTDSTPTDGTRPTDQTKPTDMTKPTDFTITHITKPPLEAVLCGRCNSADGCGYDDTYMYCHKEVNYAQKP